MVGREVQPKRDRWMKSLDRFELARTPAELQLANDVDLFRSPRRHGLVPWRARRKILCQRRRRIDSRTADNQIVMIGVLICCWTANHANVLRAEGIDR